MSLEYMPAKVVHVKSIEDIPAYLVKDTEKYLLLELGFPTDLHDFKIGDAVDFMQYLGQQGIVLDQKAREIVRERGYEWRREQSLQHIQPKTALYLDAYARLNEIHTEQANSIQGLDNLVYQDERDRQKVIRDIMQRAQK